jgi:hypothetical protein
MDVEAHIHSALWNSPVRDFLELLAAHEIWDVVLFGGAVRDAVLGDPIQDWDVAVVLTDPGHERMAIDIDADYVVLPQAQKPFARLAEALGASSLEDVLEERAEFQGRRVDLLGLLPVLAPDGAAYPDIFATTTFGTRVHLSAVLTVNQLAADARGRVYGMQYAEDLLQRRVVFANPPAVEPRALYRMARLLVRTRRSRLTIPSSTRRLVESHLKALEAFPSVISGDLCLPELRKLSAAPELAELTWEPACVIPSMQAAFAEVPKEALPERSS